MTSPNRSSRIRHFSVFIMVISSLAVASGCGEWLDELQGKESPTATPSGTNTVTPTPTGTATPPTPTITTSGDITTFDFGTIALDAGESPIFAFNAPAGTIGMDFIVVGAAADAAKIFAFFSMTGPNNRTVINNSANGPVRQGFNDGAMSFALPADDTVQSAAEAGPWEFFVAAFDPAPPNDPVASNPRVLVKVRTNAGGVVPTGLLDLNIIVVGGNAWGFSATAATTDTELQGALTRMQNLYLDMAISIGTVTYYDLDLANAMGFANVSSETELANLFATSAGLPDNRVNLFFIDALSGSLSGAAGIAGGIPVPQDLNGTLHSGVAITFQGSQTGTSEVMAHEAGHSLGMYHTTEFGGQSFDPISDTPECPTIPSGCTDVTNVMYPQITGQFSIFTAGQGTVIKPAIHVKRDPTFTFAPVKVADPLPPDIAPGELLLECHEGVMSWAPSR